MDTLHMVVPLQHSRNDARIAGNDMTTRQWFKDYTPRTNGKRSIEEAISEVQREMDVRRRLFDKWCSESRMSWVDAHDRLERLMSALHLLIQYSKHLDQQTNSGTNPPTVVTELSSPISLDAPPQEAAA